MKRIAFYGGTFDPIHFGHLHLAQGFAAQLKFDRILLIPTRVPPHKTGCPAPAVHRLNMCRLAAEHLTGFQASDIELRREGKSYTVDTAKLLRSANPGARLFMIVGSDMFLTLDEWHDAQTLFQLVTACAAPRAEGQEMILLEKQRALEKMGVESVVCQFRALPISSTEIRERIAAGRPIRDLVPDYIETYIHEHGLYSGNPSGAGAECF